MAKILVSAQKVFGGSLSASGNIAKFGSLAAGAAAYSLDPAVIQALAQYGLGWDAATVGNASPALQDRNALDYLFSRQIAYQQQIGLTEWAATINFADGAWCQNGAGVAYVSQGADNLNHLLSDTNWWLPLTTVISETVVPQAQRLSAWVVFNGQVASPGNIIDNFGISEVGVLGPGVYDLYLDSPMPNANYGYNLSLTQQDGAAATVMATRFPGDTKNVNTLRVRTVSCFDSSGFNCPEVCVSIFAKP